MANVMFDPNKKCPLLKKKCIQHDCQWFIQLQGKHPNTGADIDEWGCAIAWMPILLIENAKEVRQGAAATESFRNQMVKQGDVVFELIEANQIKQLSGK